MLEVKNIYKSFGQKEVLHNVGFTLENREVAAFLGVNGAGKSTLMNIIAGVLPAGSGDVLVDGLNIKDNAVEVKRKIGYLPENNPLYGDMYVREYLEYVARIYVRKGEVRDKVSGVIEQVGLASEYKKKISTLSHGNRQRVGLAQALVHDPEILILDEPSNGLDPVQQLKINNLIKELGQTRTVLFSSHRLDDVSDVASRYLIIKEGHLVLDEVSVNIDSIKDRFYTLQ